MHIPYGRLRPVRNCSCQRKLSNYNCQTLCVCVRLRLESIEWIIGDHPFSPANELAPRPSLSSPSPGRNLSLFLFFLYLWSKPESIECFIEERMIWLLAQPSPLLPAESCLSFSVFLPVELTEGKGGEGSKILRRRENLVLYNCYSLLSGVSL